MSISCQTMEITDIHLCVADSDIKSQSTLNVGENTTQRSLVSTRLSGSRYL